MLWIWLFVLFVILISIAFIFADTTKHTDIHQVKKSRGTLKPIEGEAGHAYVDDEKIKSTLDNSKQANNLNKIAWIEHVN